jgi:hypothetical protein
MSLHDIFQAMYDSRLGTALAESLYVYPMATCSASLFLLV